jgi:hypothetical protein
MYRLVCKVVVPVAATVAVIVGGYLSVGAAQSSSNVAQVTTAAAASPSDINWG